MHRSKHMWAQVMIMRGGSNRLMNSNLTYLTYKRYCSVRATPQEPGQPCPVLVVSPEWKVHKLVLMSL
jgi:hypothetical protein